MTGPQSSNHSSTPIVMLSQSGCLATSDDCKASHNYENTVCGPPAHPPAPSKPHCICALLHWPFMHLSPPISSHFLLASLFASHLGIAISCQLLHWLVVRSQQDFVTRCSFNDPWSWLNNGAMETAGIAVTKQCRHKSHCVLQTRHLETEIPVANCRHNARTICTCNSCFNS